MTLEINYEDELLQAGEKSIVMPTDTAGDFKKDPELSYQMEVYKDLIYNSTAAFALIDNLEKINYNFTDTTYSVARKEIEVLYHLNLSELLIKENWKAQVQDQLKSSEFINKSIEEAFVVN